jgi:hypothetical protein
VLRSKSYLSTQPLRYRTNTLFNKKSKVIKIFKLITTKCLDIPHNNKYRLVIIDGADSIEVPPEAVVKNIIKTQKIAIAQLYDRKNASNILITCQ